MKVLLIALFLIISRSLYGDIIDEFFVFGVVHTIFIEKVYYSRILVLPDLYSFGNVSTSNSWSRVVPRFYNSSLMAEFPPLLKEPNREAKLIIFTRRWTLCLYLKIYKQIKIKNQQTLLITSNIYINIWFFAFFHAQQTLFSKFKVFSVSHIIPFIFLFNNIFLIISILKSLI